MAGRGKKYKNAAVKRDPEDKLNLSDACKLIPEMKCAKFDESVDIAIRLGVDPKHADQMVRGALMMPNGTGRTMRVAVFAKGEKAAEATAAGADKVGAEDLAKEFEAGDIGVDAVVATPDMMAVVGKLGRVLGPRGLMPNPKVGTVTNNVEKVVTELKSGRIEFRVEKSGIIHAPVGKASFPPAKLEENIFALMETIIRMKPASAKGNYLKSVAISTTMGPSIRIDTAEISARVI